MQGQLVCGISARKRLDNDYRFFIKSAALHIGTILNNALAYELGQALQNQQTLNEELAAANEESEFRISGPINIITGDAIDYKLFINGKSHHAVTFTSVFPTRFELISAEPESAILSVELREQWPQIYYFTG